MMTMRMSGNNEYNDSPQSHASPEQQNLLNQQPPLRSDPLHKSGDSSQHIHSGSQTGDLDLMIDPWSGDPLNFEAAVPVLVPGAGDDRSVISQEVTSVSVRTDVSGPGPELRRFQMAVVASPIMDKDPMNRTTSPMPYESKKLIPKWEDCDFEAAGPAGEAAATKGKVTFAAAIVTDERGCWTPSPAHDE